MEKIFDALAVRQVPDNPDRDQESCPRNFDELSQADPIVGNTTFHRVMVYTSAATMAVSVALGTFMILSQVFSYREPRVQKHLIRIILTGPVFAILSFIGVAAYGTAHYMEALLTFYEIFTLYSVFTLCLEYLAPATTWEAQLVLVQANSVFKFKSFRRKFFRVVQVIPVMTVMTLATIIIHAQECWMNHTSQRASVVVSAIIAISTITAISGILPFLTKQTAILKKSDPQVVGKLLAAKVIVVAEIIISLIFAILSATDSFEPTSTVSYNDIHVGVHVFATSCLALISVLLMLPFYRVSQFEKHPWVAAPGDGHWTDTTHATANGNNSDNDQQLKPDGAVLLPRKSREPSPKKSPFRAVWDVINVSDVAVAVYRGIKLLFGRPRIPNAGTDLRQNHAYSPVDQRIEGGEELPSYRGA